MYLLHKLDCGSACVAEVGLQTFVDLLEFIGSLIMSEGEGIHLGLDIFGLGLLQAALNAGAQALARWDSGRALHAPIGARLQV